MTTDDTGNHDTETLAEEREQLDEAWQALVRSSSTCKRLLQEFQCNSSR